MNQYEKAVIIQLRDKLKQGYFEELISDLNSNGAQLEWSAEFVIGSFQQFNQLFENSESEVLQQLKKLMEIYIHFINASDRFSIYTTKSSISLSKLITHLALKVLKKDFRYTCRILCETLVTFMSRIGNKAPVDIRRSVCVFTYRHVWNAMISSPNAVEETCSLRIAALMLVTSTATVEPAPLLMSQYVFTINMAQPKPVRPAVLDLCFDAACKIDPGRESKWRRIRLMCDLMLTQSDDELGAIVNKIDKEGLLLVMNGSQPDSLHLCQDVMVKVCENASLSQWVEPINTPVMLAERVNSDSTDQLTKMCSWAALSIAAKRLVQTKKEEVPPPWLADVTNSLGHYYSILTSKVDPMRYYGPQDSQSDITATIGRVILWAAQRSNDLNVNHKDLLHIATKSIQTLINVVKRRDIGIQENNESRTLPELTVRELQRFPWFEPRAVSPILGPKLATHTMELVEVHMEYLITTEKVVQRTTLLYNAAHYFTTMSGLEGIRHVLALFTLCREPGAIQTDPGIVALWCDFRKIVNTTDPNHRLATEPLADAVYKDKPVTERLDLLIEEFQTYAYSTKHERLALSCLQSMKQISKENQTTHPMERVKYLLWQIKYNIHSSPVSIHKSVKPQLEVDQALSILNKSMKKPHARELKALVLVWKRVIDFYNQFNVEEMDVILIQQQRVEVSPSNFTTERQKLRDLDEALQLLQEIVKYEESSLLYEEEVVNCMDIMFMFYKLHGRLRCCLDVSSLGIELFPEHRTVWHVRKLQALVMLGEVVDAATVSGMLDKMGGNSSPISTLYDYERDVYNAGLIWLQGNPTEACHRLENVCSRANSKRADVFYRRIQCLAKRWQVLIAMHGQVSLPRGLAYHVDRSQLDHAAIFLHLKTQDTSHDCIANRIDTLHAFLESQITSARFFKSCGILKEWTIYLDNAYNYAQLLQLPIRVAQVGGLQAELFLFLSEISQAESLLESSKLNPKINQPKLVSGRNAKPLKSEGDDSDDENFIKQPTRLYDEPSQGNDDEYAMPRYGTDLSTDATASPGFSRKNKTFSVRDEIPQLQHSKSCSCDLCFEPLLQDVCVRRVVAIATKHRLAGDSEQAVFICKDLRENMNQLNKNNCISEIHLAEWRLAIFQEVMYGLINMDRPTTLRYELMAASKSLGAFRPVFPAAFARLDVISTLVVVASLRTMYSNNQSILAGGFSEMDSDFQWPLSHKEPVPPSFRVSPFRHPNSKPVAKPSTANKAPRKTKLLTSRLGLNCAGFDLSDEEDVKSLVKHAETPARPAQSGQTAKATRGVARTRVVSTKTPAKGLQIYCDCPDGEADPPAPTPLKSKRRNNKPKVAAEDSRSAAVGDKVEPLKPPRTRSRKKMESLRGDENDERSAGIHTSPVHIPTSPIALATHQHSGSVSNSTNQRSKPTNHTTNQNLVPEVFRGPKIPLRPDGIEAEWPRSARPPLRETPTNITNSPANMKSGRTKTLPPPTATDSVEDALGRLTSIWPSIARQPEYLTYRTAAQALGVLHLKKGNMSKAAFYFTESQAVTLRHKAEEINCRLLVEKQIRDQGAEKRCSPGFNHTLESFDKYVLEEIPEGLVIVALHHVSLVDGGEPAIYITRLERGQAPLVYHAHTVNKLSKYDEEFKAIMDGSKDSTGVTDGKLWWTLRRDLNKRMSDLLKALQNDLRFYKFLFGGSHQDADLIHQYMKTTAAEFIKYDGDLSRNMIRDQSIEKSSLLKVLLETTPAMSSSHLRELTGNIFDETSHKARIAISEYLVKVTSEVINGDDQLKMRNPVILIPDKGLHHLPWESMPYLTCQQQITRMPSIHMLSDALEYHMLNERSVVQAGIDNTQAFYVLNPQANLDNTEQAFKELLLQQETWKGYIGVEPPAEQYTEGLMSRDIFLYMGHGNGSKFLRASKIARLKRCQSSVLLMGCSSGAMDARGLLEPAGIINDYLIARCPSIMANLWDVTDKDIDRYTLYLIRTWLLQQQEDTDALPRPDLLHHVGDARNSCVLPYLVGSAAVVYGLPPIRVRTKL